METCDDDNTDGEDQSSKLKPKKKSLCRLLLQKKTRVGCLSTESEEISLQENIHNNWPIKQKDVKDENCSQSPVKKSSNVNKVDIDPNKVSGTKGNQEVQRVGSPRDFSSSTKLSLCCAMTESSRSLNHLHSSNYHRSIDLEKNKENGKNIEKSHGEGSNIEKSSGDERNVEKYNENSINTVVSACKEPEIVDKRMHSVNKASSVDETRLSAARLRDITDLQQQENSQSVPVSRQPSLRISQSPTPSEISSCDSSPPLQISSQARLRRRLLAQRRSADNLLISSTSCPSPTLRHSSPDSSRSAPEPNRGYKKRSSSHDTMLPPKQEAKDKKMSVAARGSIGNVGPENGAIRGIVASMDSLARHSLLAAQVLHLIPTTKARERNFLHGRIAATSLLGLVELERTLPQRELRIFVGTWNMNGQETVGPSHLLLHSATLGTLHLAIFIRRDLLWYCSVPEESSFSVRPGTAFKTKGAVAIAFMLFGTSFLFITSHLTAHLEKVKERIQDVRRIVRSLDLPKQIPVRHKSKGSVFREFDEGPITFPPTYKYDPGTQRFDTSHKQRAPAYTDRILFKAKSTSHRRDSTTSNAGGPLECLMYTSVPSICTSDHKPVWGLYRSTVRPGIDTIPLAAGLFNREVYLEGIKRRAAAMDKRKGTSTICTIQ
ncbi:hypothetical protein C0J52_17662 [Blattella germanica]|nr:hypothetical protein C0J52_17662 [Blattella germanica]